MLALNSTPELVAPAEWERMHAIAAARSQGPDAPAVYEMRSQRKDGSTAWIDNRS